MTKHLADALNAELLALNVSELHVALKPVTEKAKTAYKLILELPSLVPAKDILTVGSHRVSRVATQIPQCRQRGVQDRGPTGKGAPRLGEDKTRRARRGVSLRFSSPVLGTLLARLLLLPLFCLLRLRDAAFRSRLRFVGYRSILSDDRALDAPLQS